MLRRIFRICYARFKELVAIELGGYGRRDAEFCADFCLIAKRALGELDHKIFRLHFLLGADSRLCIRRLGMPAADFAERVRSIEAQLGKLFAELEPYPLFPLAEYYSRRPRELVNTAS